MNPITKSEATNEHKNYLEELEENSELGEISGISLLKLNKKNSTSGSPRSHIKLTKDMSYLSTQYAQKLIKNRERKGSEGTFCIKLESS